MNTKETDDFSIVNGITLSTLALVDRLEEIQSACVVMGSIAGSGASGVETGVNNELADTGGFVESDRGRFRWIQGEIWKHCIRQWWLR